MDGMLSQDEINALLNEMAVEQPAESTPVQETLDTTSAEDGLVLSDAEKDAIGEVANISMGTSATTLYSLVNRKVNITTPVVSISNWEELTSGNNLPYIFIQVGYTAGLNGNNILILQENDVKVITNLMMGGDGTELDDEINEIHLSAISEAMNQMMGSSATSLSQMLGTVIDISPPVSARIEVSDQEIPGGNSEDNFLAGSFVKISFRITIDGLVDSTILQLYPIDFARELVATFLNGGVLGEQKAEAKPFEPPKVEVQPETVAPQPQSQPVPQPQVGPGNIPNYGQGMPMYNQGMPMYQMPPMYQVPPMGTNYQPAQFEQFSSDVGAVVSNENIGLIMDVPLEVTVELGRTKKNISDILDFAPGTIIELNRIAGEPIDVLVNGKFVAKGEVVVIEENFGIRVTEIIK